MVVPDVKDTNLWEQFTTSYTKDNRAYELFLMSKIRTYESNSQLWYAFQDFAEVVPDVKDTNLWEQFTTCMTVSRSTTCCSWCQRYELMRAIHNLTTDARNEHRVVPDVKDTNLWEQFTTSSSTLNVSRGLFLMSKIRTYESNSQPQSLIEKRYIVVPDVKDTNLWEQFTTAIRCSARRPALFLMSKIRTYESNSQHPQRWRNRRVRCSWCQRYELMRAIHNSFVSVISSASVVPDVKDTNLWEQFTTWSRIYSLAIGLFLMSKIRTYESNSQQCDKR